MWLRSLKAIGSIWIFGLLGACSSTKAGDTPPAPVVPVGERSIEELTLALVNSSDRYQLAPEAERTAMLATMHEVASARHTKMSTLMEKEPGQVLRLRIPAEKRAGMP